MKRNALAMAAGLALLAAAAVPAGAQTSAEVRTWAGHTYQLTEPSLEVLYTIVVPKKEEGSGPSEGAPSTGARAPMLFGSASAIGQFLDKQPEPLHGHRQSETITLRQARSEVRLALASVDALVFARQAARSTLPPYVVPDHYRYSVIAVLDDGSRVEGDSRKLSCSTGIGSGEGSHQAIDWLMRELRPFGRSRKPKSSG